MADLVLEVDGRPVRDLDHQDVVKMLRDTKGQIVLTVATSDNK